MSNKILKLDQAQTLYQDLRERIDVLPTSEDIPEVPVQDVQINGSSIISNGVASIPVGSNDNFGVYKTGSYGITVMNMSGHEGTLAISSATNSEIKASNGSFKVITPSSQHRSVFYGLAKASGDTTQSQSSNAVGSYTPEAKGAIQKMLGVSDLIAPEENDLVASKAYKIGEIFTANGKLYRATAAIAADGAIIVDGANANCEETYISEDLSDKVAKSEIDYAGISKYTYSTKFGGEFTVTTATTSGYSYPYARAAVTGIASKHKLHRVTINGTEYILSPKLWFKTTGTSDFKVYTYLGKLSLYVSNTTGVPGTADDVPFLIFFDINDKSSIDVITQTAGTYTIKIEEMTPTQKELPKSLIYGDNYVPIEKNNNGGTYNGFSIGVNELKNTRGSIAIGYTNSLSHEYTKAFGEANKITGKYGMALGVFNTVSGVQAIAIGSRNTASDLVSIAEGSDTTASGANAHSEGYATLASGVMSHAEGNGSMAEAEGAHAEGVYSTASGASSHAEGAYGTASGRASHTEGEGNIAAGADSHAEGLLTIANGAGTHVSGIYNRADTVYDAWVANTSYSVGDKVFYKNYGYRCITANSDATWTAAHWENITHSSDKAVIIGNGISDSERSNAFALTWEGDGKYAGDVYVKCNNDSTGGVKLATVEDIPEVPVQDVQVNGVSVLTDGGVANIPQASKTELGLVKIRDGYGITIRPSTGEIAMDAAIDEIKPGLSYRKPITPATQHESTFYGLAKASGDTTQSTSSNAVGAYTDEAKIAIQKMLGVYEAPWELIKEDTFTNETEADHVITTDANGNPLELTDVALLFSTPKQESESKWAGSGSIVMRIQTGTSARSLSLECGGYTQATNGTAHIASAHMRQIGNSIEIYRGGTATESNSGTLAYRVTAGLNGLYDTATDRMFFSLTQQVVYVDRLTIRAVTGTGYYKLYGKRKWQ